MELKADLGRCGLNSYESAAYVALVRNGMCTAHVLSKESGVPYGKIYPVLASLENKGFVKLFAGMPKRFMAVEPKIVVGQTIAAKEKELSAFKQQAHQLVKTLGAFAERKQDETADTIRVIEGYKNYLNLSIALHQQARQEWLSITELTIHKEHFDATKACIKRGVSVRLLTYKEEQQKKNIDLWRKIGAKIKFVEYTPAQFSIIDGKQVTIRITGEEKYIALWIQNQSLAQSMKNYFGILWEKS
ncbi:TrmB family transcriptional regulator [Candidatus Woesearchaeota archaeon]|nr:TrmB family transcriptional regulator [Candidatus Woesearchaeota archaeon]